MILALAVIAAFALGVELGRWWQRGKIDSLRDALAAEKKAHRATARRSDEHRARARELAAKLANRGAA